MIAAMHGLSCSGRRARAGRHGVPAGDGCARAECEPAAACRSAAGDRRAAARPQRPRRAAGTLPTPQETFGAIGRAIDQSIQSLGAGVNAGVRGTAETLGATTNAAGDLAKGVGDAAGTVARLPATNAVTGRERLPDCTERRAGLRERGAGALPHEGLSRGNSLDITSAYKCPPQMWREGRAPNPQECTDEFVRLARALPVAVLRRRL